MGIKTYVVRTAKEPEAVYLSAADAVINFPETDGNIPEFLDIDRLVGLAREYKIDSLHPGYGYLSENAELAERCRDNGIVFIGPSPEVIRLMGDKVAAKGIAAQSGVPMLGASQGAVHTLDEARKIAKRLGYPVIIKAVSGGGGRGMRIVHHQDELEQLYKIATAEAQVAFNDPSVFIEKYLENPKHIEFQIVADNYGNVVHLGERECSIQRKHQKLMEEAPSPALDERLRKKMAAAAVSLAKQAGYQSLGTVEFLLDHQKHFYFMEMNTRIQVEHGVTELVTGVDLVHQQLRIASGLALRLRQEDVTLQGHAIECRINAEDPVQGFRPCPGRVDFLHFPGGPGVRVDSCLYSGCELSPYYDSMAAKILAYAPTRMETIRRMRRCLEEFTLEGFPTNAELSYQILYHPEFILGECTTAFLDEHLSELLEFSRKLSESGVDA